jgi:hypothetical protein
MTGAGMTGMGGAGSTAMGPMGGAETGMTGAGMTGTTMAGAGSTAMGMGGAGSTAMEMEPEMGGSDSMEGEMGGSSMEMEEAGGAGMEGNEEERVTFADVHPILQANCSGMMCHGDGATNGHPPFAMEDMTGAEAAAVGSETNGDMNKQITNRISRAAGSMGFMPRNGMALSADDIATIEAWAQSLE